MMAGEQCVDWAGGFSHGVGFWLPPEILAPEDDDLFLGGARAASPNDSSDEEQEDEYMAGLSRDMTQFFLLDDAEAHAAAGRNAKARDSSCTSPQSTLCATNYSPASATKKDPWSVLYEAADQVMRMRMQEQVAAPARKQPPPPRATPSPAPASKAHFDQAELRHRQLQAARFHALRQQQMAAAAWQKQSLARAGAVGRTWAQAHKPPAQTQSPQPGAGMRAVFLTGGAKKESAGTGVFLPRRPGANSDSRKKPGCSTVLLPARVVQALNLNLGELAAKPRAVHGHDALAGVKNNRSPVPVQKGRQAPPAVSAAAELRLPQEWTY